MSRYVAAYDIASDRRRRRVSNALLGWGERIQESVFEISLQPEEMSEFQFQIGLLLGAEDQFDLFPIDTRDASRRRRWMRPIARKPIVILA